MRALVRGWVRGLCGAGLLAAALAGQAATVLQVAIDMRGEIASGRFDPRDDRVGVRGSQPPLAWDRSQLAQDPDGDGRYTLVLRFDEVPEGGQPLQYKFKVERGQADDGWEPGVNRQWLLAEGEQQLARAFGSPAPHLPLQRTGRIDRWPAMPSRHVGARDVQVWLPPGYDPAAPRRYPVLYLHDGQNVFDSAAAGAEWQVDETADRLVRAGAIEPLLIVAVSVSDAGSRGFDYTPQPGRYRGQTLGGGAPAYARFLVDELKPLIDARYRTLTGAAHTWTGGSSLGGLLTMWLLTTHADVFGGGLVVSPAVWWADAAIVRDVMAWPPGLARPRVWLDIGLGEGQEAVAGARQLHQALQARGWEAARLRYVEAPGAGHTEAAWAARVEPMLRFLAPAGDR